MSTGQPPDELALDETDVVSLLAEITALRVEVNQLRAKNAELLRLAAVRDFERPPHYQ